MYFGVLYVPHSATFYPSIHNTVAVHSCCGTFAMLLFHLTVLPRNPQNALLQPPCQTSSSSHQAVPVLTQYFASPYTVMVLHFHICYMLAEHYVAADLLDLSLITLRSAVAPPPHLPCAP